MLASLADLARTEEGREAVISADLLPQLLKRGAAELWGDFVFIFLSRRMGRTTQLMFENNIWREAIIVERLLNPIYSTRDLVETAL